MKYYSTNNRNKFISAGEAILHGLAEDGGLYMPAYIPQLPESFLNSQNSTIHEVANEVLKDFFLEDIQHSKLLEIIEDAFNFKLPIIQLNEKLFALELFHGPTFSFKDVGARFMARLLSHIATTSNQNTIVLTATSGDTGSAVAHGYYDMTGVNVFIFYPKNGVSEIQEKQMTTLGKNIFPIKIHGSFDDCQNLVKRLLVDAELRKTHVTTSANSINIGRLLPQII
jgi:threonine synthase